MTATPAQGRNLEIVSEKMLDRTKAIWTSSPKGRRRRGRRVPIELAPAPISFARLNKDVDPLVAKPVGIGTAVRGEPQLEVDRRRVQERIARLERNSEDVRTPGRVATART